MDESRIRLQTGMRPGRQKLSSRCWQVQKQCFLKTFSRAVQFLSPRLTHRQRYLSSYALAEIPVNGFEEKAGSAIDNLVWHAPIAACPAFVLYHAFHAQAIVGSQTMKALSTPGSAAYDRWFRSKIQEALDDCAPSMDNKIVKRIFAAKRAALKRRTTKRMETST